MPILGAHLSIAGGFYRAVERAHELDCDCVQIFVTQPRRWPAARRPSRQAAGKSAPLGHPSTRNNNLWRTKPITDDEVAAFRHAIAQTKVRHVVAHASYLINLASSDSALFKKSSAALVTELKRAGRLGIPYVVVHPGAFTTSSESAGIKQIIRAVNDVHKRTTLEDAQCLLENTAGQGSCLGWRFEQLGAIIDGVREPQRLGVCIDSCHAFAAGYPWAPRNQYLATIRQLKQSVGLDRIKVWHLNDSVRELGSRVDRHANIGQGQMGIEPFHHLLCDRRFRSVPMILETPQRAIAEDLKILRSASRPG